MGEGLDLLQGFKEHLVRHAICGEKGITEQAGVNAPSPTGRGSDSRRTEPGALGALAAKPGLRVKTRLTSMTALQAAAWPTRKPTHHTSASGERTRIVTYCGRFPISPGKGLGGGVITDCLVC